MFFVFIIYRIYRLERSLAVGSGVSGLANNQLITAQLQFDNISESELLKNHFGELQQSGIADFNNFSFHLRS